MSIVTRRVPAGAEVQEDGTTQFRVWAPRPREVRLCVAAPGGPSIDVGLEADGDGYYSGRARAGAGWRYQYRLDGELVADPASRFQPEGVCGPSEIVDHRAFAWTDQRWRGVSLPGQVLYELHVGTFTREGTWRAAAQHLPRLRDIGITVIEVMPVAEFPGRFGWGYDGVFPYAPTRLYGTPDDFRSFVDRAHALGLGVILDVVYNHLGPEGCVFHRYAPQYYSSRYKGEWGEPLNFDGDDAGPVRDFFSTNAACWIEEFHLDGLRLDATQGIHDASDEHIVAEVTRRARAAAGERRILVIAENEPQLTRLVRPVERGGYGLDALWNDDFHHSAFVAATGRREAYFSDHAGTAQELVSCAKHGYLFQGQWYGWQRQPRGTSGRGLSPAAFVNYLENHDQVPNSGDGSRLRQNTSPGTYRALSALLLLAPGTPMVFQGQECGVPTPFYYFADLGPDLAEAVQRGRSEFVVQFPSLATPEMQARLPRVNDIATFERSKVGWNEPDPGVTRLYRDLLAVRHDTRVFDEQAAGAVDGAVIGHEQFALRYFGDSPDDERLLLVNLGADFHAASLAEPLVAPPDGFAWRVGWSSESPEYGGLGTPDVFERGGWYLPGRSALLLEPDRGGDRSSRH